MTTISYKVDFGRRRARTRVEEPAKPVPKPPTRLAR